MTALAEAINQHNNPQSQEKNSLAHGHIIPAAAIYYNYLTGIKPSLVSSKHSNLYNFAFSWVTGATLYLRSAGFGWGGWGGYYI